MEGWHRALDVQLDQHKWILSDQGGNFTFGVLESLFDGIMDEADPTRAADYGEMFTKLLIQTLWQGDTMFITSDMLHVAMQAAEDLPEDYVFDSRVCLSNHGFILFEEAIVNQDRNGKNLVYNGLAWATEHITVRGDLEPSIATCIYMFSDVNDTRDDSLPQELRDKLKELNIYVPPISLCHFYPLVHGDKVLKGNNPGQQSMANMVKLFVAIQILSHQSIGTVTRNQPNRAQRKRYERDYHVASNRMITLITLRRKSMPSGKEPADIPWTRRWVVRGHWRNQWYPKTKTHGWKYIYEYIKGPEDKPLITGRRVFNFRR